MNSTEYLDQNFAFWAYTYSVSGFMDNGIGTYCNILDYHFLPFLESLSQDLSASKFLNVIPSKLLKKEYKKLSPDSWVRSIRSRWLQIFSISKSCLQAMWPQTMCTPTYTCSPWSNRSPIPGSVRPLWRRCFLCGDKDKSNCCGAVAVARIDD